MRSPTAADIVAAWPGFEADFAGLSNDADEHLSSEHLEWADMVVVMERRQKRVLQQRFATFMRDVPVHVLDVPDRFAFMDPALVDLITPRLRRLLAP
ncbi:MAG: phosphotyrosine protein phosphatase [Tateyamaria sp.]|uniref:phosphotyrosine protein phosphatase n=1 Tax=Tateyamaria sp. TaxID=1929288 RepID=UPI00329F1DFC